MSFYYHLPVLRIETYRGKYETSTVNISFFKECLFFDRFCSSLLVFNFSARTDRRRGLLSKKRTGVGRGRKGMKSGKYVRTSFMDGPLT